MVVWPRAARPSSQVTQAPPVATYTAQSCHYCLWVPLTHAAFSLVCSYLWHGVAPLQRALLAVGYGEAVMYMSILEAALCWRPASGLSDQA